MRIGALAVGAAVLAAAGAVALVATGSVSLTVGQPVEVGPPQVELNVGEAVEVPGSTVEVSVGEAREVMDELVPLTEDELVPLTEDELVPLSLPRVPGATPAFAFDVRFVLRVVERSGGILNHTIDFSSSTRVTNVTRVGTGGNAIAATTSVAQGSGRGVYIEVGDHADGVCAVHILKDGTASMDVRVQVDIAEVNVRLGGTLQRQESGRTADCADRTTGVEDGTRPVYGCNFFEVDLRRGGRFKANDELDYAGGNDLVEWECTLTLTPIPPTTPTPTRTPLATPLPTVIATGTPGTPPPTPPVATSTPSGGGLPLCPTAPAGPTQPPSGTPTPCVTPSAP